MKKKLTKKQANKIVDKLRESNTPENIKDHIKDANKNPECREAYHKEKDKYIKDMTNGKTCI